MSFEQNSYRVSEGNNVSVTVVLSSAGSQQYTVNIVSRDNSATGEYNDSTWVWSHCINSL